MLALILRTIKTNRLSLIIYLAISVTFVWVFVEQFPAVQQQSGNLKQAFGGLPEPIAKAFDLNSGVFFNTLPGFMGGKYFSLIWPIILIVLVLTLSSSAIAGEIEAGTMELLLAQPISRLKIFFAKYFSGIAIMATFVFISNLSAIPFASLYHISFKAANFFTISILGFLFAFAVFGICFMLSAFFSSRGKPLAITGGLLIIMYALNIFSAFQESLDKLKYASFFHYYDHKAALLNNHIDTVSIVVFFGVGIICTIIGAVAFVKRDIATS